MRWSPVSHFHYRATTQHTFVPSFQAHLLRVASTSTMSEYNNLFDFNATTTACDLSGSPNPGPTPAMDQSGSLNAALYPSFGLMEGGTAAQLHAPVNLAPSKGARSNG